jgi:hypothetical protein
MAKARNAIVYTPRAMVRVIAKPRYRDNTTLTKPPITVNNPFIPQAQATAPFE